MATVKRKIVHIDEEKCDGCGRCVPACAEGAIRIIDGKARLVNEAFCDGLGACLGECPQGAIGILEHEATPFDPQAVNDLQEKLPLHSSSHSARSEGEVEPLPCGCPGSAVMELDAPGCRVEDETGLPSTASRLANWPVQLRLVPTSAPYLKGSRLLLAADCTGFASPDFHRRFLPGRVLLVGCPKLDDASFYREKLAAILAENDVRELVVIHMEVPCCFGLANLAIKAVKEAGRDIPVIIVKLGVNGQVLESSEMERTVI
jgi:ferredoxin